MPDLAPLRLLDHDAAQPATSTTLEPRHYEPVDCELPEIVREHLGDEEHAGADRPARREHGATPTSTRRAGMIVMLARAAPSRSTRSWCSEYFGKRPRPTTRASSRRAPPRSGRAARSSTSPKNVQVEQADPGRLADRRARHRAVRAHARGRRRARRVQDPRVLPRPRLRGPGAPRRRLRALRAARRSGAAWPTTRTGARARSTTSPPSAWRSRATRACSWVPIHLGGHLTKQTLDIITAEQGSDMRHTGLYFTERDEHLDLFTTDRTRPGHTTGDTVWKGALTGESRASYEGLIHIVPGAQKTHTYLQTHSMLLSPKAKADAIPSLIVRDRQRLGLARRHRRRARRGADLLHDDPRHPARRGGARAGGGLLRGGRRSGSRTRRSRSSCGGASPRRSRPPRRPGGASSSASADGRRTTDTAGGRPRGLPRPRARDRTASRLAYLDSAATSQKPTPGDRGDGPLLPRVQRHRAPRRLRARRARPPSCSRARASGSPRSSAGTRPRRSSPTTPPRRSTSWRTPGAATTSAPATRCSSPRWSTTRTSSPGSCSARTPAPSCATCTWRDDGTLSLDELDAVLAEGRVKLVGGRARVERARHDQPGGGDRRAGARGGRGGAGRRRAGGAAAAGGRVARSAPTSTPGPATRRSAPRASACCTAAASCSSRCGPSSAAAHMISRVERRAAPPGTSCRWKFEAGTSRDRRGDRAGRRGGLPLRDRHGATCARTSASSPPTPSSGCPRCEGLTLYGPPDAGAPRRRGVVRDRGHAPARHRRALRPRGGLHPRRPPLRAAAHAPAGRGRHGPRLLPRLQRARGRGPAGRGARTTPGACSSSS